jgi:hypothetical protein
VVLTTAALYFGYLAFGCLAPIRLVKLQEIGVGFYRFFGFTCVVLQALSFGFLLFSGNDRFGPIYFAASIAFLLFTLVFTLALRSRRENWIRWSFWSAVFSGLLTVILPWSHFILPPHLEAIGDMAEKMGWGPAWFYMLHALTAALVMGFATLAMMLGHWYLVTPKLSITPLKRFAGGYILLTLFMALQLTVAYLEFIGLRWNEPASFLGGVLKKEVIFAIFRVTWGVLAPLGFSYWIWETVKMKSTQSATGILYAAMVCTLIGEGIGLFLTLQTGVPF